MLIVKVAFILEILIGSSLIDSNLAQINYFGVAYSPYVRSDNAAWNSYTLEDIKQMLRIILTYHNSVATYGMGVSQWNYQNAWDKADSSCLISRGAAHINRERGAVVLSISQGIYQQDQSVVQQKEIDNAFIAAEEANRIFPGTVYNMIFTNEYVTDGSNGPKVLQMIRANKNRAHRMNLRVGTRIHTCGEIWGGPNQQIIKEIVRESDFIMCNLYPKANTADASNAIQDISDSYYSARDGFWRENPRIEVIIGETGWSSSGQNFYNPAQFNHIENLRKFWEGMKNWSTRNQVKVQMFEAFDEHWKPGLPGEKTFGWWKRSDDNSRYYIEKTTGKRFN